MSNIVPRSGLKKGWQWFLNINYSCHRFDKCNSFIVKEYCFRCASLNAACNCRPLFHQSTVEHTTRNEHFKGCLPLVIVVRATNAVITKCSVSKQS